MCEPGAVNHITDKYNDTNLHRIDAITADCKTVDEYINLLNVWVKDKG